MPVVVTGADTKLGHAVVHALAAAEAGRDLRATVDDRAQVTPLVERGVRTAVSDLVDTERFGAVVEAAHTVIHLRGSDTGAGAVLAGIADVLAALPDSGVRRVVTLSGFGLDEHPALTALRESEYDAVVLRVGAVLAPDPPDGRWPSWRPRGRRLAPLHADDLVAALVAADHLRDLSGYVELDAVGADVVTAGELDRLLGVPASPFYPRLRGTADLAGDAGRRLGEVLGVTPRPLAAAVEALRAGR